MDGRGILQLTLFSTAFKGKRKYLKQLLSACSPDEVKRQHADLSGHICPRDHLIKWATQLPVSFPLKRRLTVCSTVEY